MQIITITAQLFAIFVALVVVKHLALAVHDLLRSVVRERRQMLRALAAGAVVGAALGLAAALRNDLSVVLLMTSTAMSVVLSQTLVAVFIEMHRKQSWAFVVHDAMYARYNRAQ